MCAATASAPWPSTLLHELDWPHAAIELMLDHVHGDKVSDAYNHAEHLEVRVKMMQAWGDYLDGLREGTAFIASSRIHSYQA